MSNMIQTSNQSEQMMIQSSRGPLSNVSTGGKTSHSSYGSSKVNSYSNRASQAIARGRYPEAVELYELALNDYLRNPPTVVELVNAAATCFNLGALHKKLQEYPQAVHYFVQAEDLYKSCEEEVANASSMHRQPPSSAVSCQVCLLQLIVETLQARAHLHYKYQRKAEESIECHEDVVAILEGNPTTHDTFYFKIHFTHLPEEERRTLLITSLQCLGKLYVERRDFEDGLMAYQEALSVLKQQTSPSQKRQDEIAQIVRALSDIYLQTSPGNTIEVLATNGPELQRLALLQEDLKNWEKALQCWERVLYWQSQEYGEESLEVATTLCQIARVMVAEGNSEGALDLYYAAAAKYNNTESPLPKDLVTNISQASCQLELHDEAIVWLREALLTTENDDNKSWIYYELGKLHLEKGQLYEASQALCESAELSESDDEHVFKLLQKVEFLQQRMEGSGGNMVLTSIVEANEDSTIGESSTMTDERKQDEKNVAIVAAAAPRLLGTHSEEKKTDDPPGFSPRSGSPASLEKNDNLFSPDPPGDEAKADITGFNAVQSSPLVTDDSSAENEGEIPTHNISELSSSTSIATETRNDSEVSREQPSVSEGTGIFENTSSQSLSPIPKVGTHNDNLLSTPVLEASPFAVETIEQANVVTPASSAKQEPEEDENSSKSTEETQQSTQNNPEVSPRELSPRESDLRSLSLSQRSDPVSAKVSSDGLDSDGGSDFGEGLQFIESDDDEEPPRASGSDTVSHVSDLNCLDSLDERDEEPAAVESSPQNEQSTTKQDSAASIGSRRSQKGLSPRSGSPSPATSVSSRTGLLKSEEKSYSNPKSLRIPTLSSPRHKTKDKKDYSEIAQSSKPTSRNRFVKALSNPFRRSRSKKNSQSNALGALDEDKEITENIEKQSPVLAFDEISVSALNAPVTFISTDDDDEMSQITFKMEEHNSSRRSRDGQWWWGVTGEGLEGWFPTSYVSQAVEAAEGFLSAKAIHDQVKSRPLDFDSDDESDVEDEGDASLSQNKGSAHSTRDKIPDSPQKPQNISVTARKASESTAKPSTGSGSAAPSGSEYSKKQSLATQIQESVDLLRRQEVENGPDTIAVASTLFNLAILYGRSGNNPGAIECAQRALKIQKGTLNSSDACRSLYFMADIHSQSNQYKPALSCLSEAQRLQERVLGYFHEETASTLNRIGSVLARQGQFDLAMENHKEALRILKECFGEDVKNPKVSQTLIQIGAVYYKERNSLATIQANSDGYTTFIEGGMLEVIGRAHEERGSYRMAIAFFEEKLQFLSMKENSDDLEQVAETLNSLGMLSCRAGLYLEAIDYYDQALAIQMKLGCDDVQLAMARVLAGSVQYSLGHFKKALKLFEDAFTTLCDEVGTEQQTVAATLFQMGMVRVSLCEYDNAMSDLRNALDIQKKLLGTEHPATLRTRREIGNLYAIYNTELDSAFKEYNEVLASQKLIHGEKHPFVAETLHSIGCAQASKGDHMKALRTLEDCYNMRLEFLGMDHPLQATSLHEIAKIQLKRGRLKKATHICESALTIRMEALGEHHIDVAEAMATKANCLVARGSFAEASKTFLEALTIAEEAVGPTHPSIARIHVKMGIMHLRKCHFEESSSAIRKALEIYRASNLDEDHPGIKEALKDLERVERAEMLCV